MTSQIFPLNDKHHRHLRVKRDHTHAHAKQQHLVPIMVDEVLDAATEFPIVFVKNANTGSFTLCVMMGLAPDSNEYCGNESMDALYVPRSLRLYPFALREKASGEGAEVCLFEAPALVNEQEGELLFTEQGEQSTFLQAQVSLLTTHQEQFQQTQAFTQLLLDQELLHEQSIKITLNGKSVNFDGVYLPNQQQLNQLEPHKLTALRDNGGLAIVYAMLNSLKQLNRLIKRQQA